MTDPKKVCILCGFDWDPAWAKSCEHCGGFNTRGAAKGAQPDSWDPVHDGAWFGASGGDQ